MMRFLRALLGIRYFNIHAEGTNPDNGNRVDLDVGNLPEKHLDKVVEAIMDWDLNDIWIKVDVA